MLERITDLFWERGLTGTSLDDLSRASGVGRPSLYATFGDKEAMYLAALAAFVARIDAALAERAERGGGGGGPLARELAAIFDGLLDLYESHAPGAKQARGCLAVCTATAEAVEHPRVREALREILGGIDRRFVALLTAARERGELAADVDVEGLGSILAATTHSLAIRARAGQGRAALRRLAAGAIGLVAPPPAKTPGQPTRRRGG